MNQLITDIWPYTMPIFLGLIVAFARYVYNLKERVAVMERVIENLTKTIDSMQKRMDNHSKKQDDILKAITDMQVSFTKQFGKLETAQASIATDVKNINRTLSIKS